MADVRCPNCGHEVPEGNFCVRCGTPLAAPAGAGASRRGGGAAFAAAPHERVLVPRIVSSVFPQLPRADMDSFRVVLVAGTVLVVALALARLFPIAVIAASLLVPLLTLLYLYGVDIYEDEPARVVAFSVIWGAVAGAGVALLTDAITSTGANVFTASQSSDVLLRGVALPALGAALMIAGPLMLLRYRKFNDVLDGATFGAACAVSFVCAGVLVFSVSLVKAGLRPPGEIVPWALRVLDIAVAMPVLAMAVIAAAAGALWLRYRAPGGRDALGPLGHPLVAVPLAVAMFIAGSVGQPLFPAGVWFAELVVLDVIALVWLRQVIHLGLLEEAAEIEIGAPVRCANCGAETPRHSFCVNCGVSLRALPKHGFAEAARSKLHRRRLIPIVVVAVGLMVVLAVVLVLVLQHGPPKPRCPHKFCGSPPVAAVSSAPALVNETVWRSSKLGFVLSFDPTRWAVSDQSDSSVVLRFTQADGLLFIEGVPGSESPSALLSARVSAFGDKVLGLAPDDSAARKILDPEVAYRHGVGGVYAGTINTPQGPGAQVELALMAAGNGSTSVVVSAITGDVSEAARTRILRNADRVLNTLRLAGDPNP